MKTRLPKSLLSALAIAAATCSLGATANAETPTITGNHTTSDWVVVSGQLNIGDGSTETNYAVGGPAVNGNNTDAFYIEGTNASVHVNKATISSVPFDSQFWIGYDKLGGSMTVEQGKIDVTNATTLGIGGGSGKSALLIKDNSTFTGGYNNFWLWGGDVTIDNKSSLNVCTSEKGYNYRALLGYTNDASITVSGGSSFTSAATQFITNYVKETTININVTGGSTFTQLATNNNEGYWPTGSSGEWVYRTQGQDNWNLQSGWYDKDSSGANNISHGHIDTITYLCDSGTDAQGRHYDSDWNVNNCTTSISATDNSRIDFQSKLTYIGNSRDKSKGNTNKSANFTIGKDSSISFKRMEIYAATNISSQDNGSFNATDITLHDGATLRYSAGSAAILEADSLTVENGAEFSLIFEEVADSVTTFALSKSATPVSMLLDTALTLKSGSVLNISGKMLNLNSNALTIEEGAIINTFGLTDEDSDGYIDLFTGVSNYEGEDTVTVQLNGVETTLSYSSGNVRFESIPEPTGATLSLLALAGLAIRRRRK